MNYDRYAAFVRLLSDEQLNLFRETFSYEDWLHGSNSRHLYDALHEEIQNRLNAPLGWQSGDTARLDWGNYVAWFKNNVHKHGPLLFGGEPPQIVTIERFEPRSDELYAQVNAPHFTVSMPIRFLEKIT